MDYGGNFNAPMSERQQMALIKGLEKEKATAAAATTAPTPSSTDGLLVSPPRTPLQVVNNQNSTGVSTPSCGMPSSHATSNSSESSSPSSFLNKHLGSPKSPALDRLMKKISKKNGKGETALHTAAIKGSRRLVKTLLQLGADPNAQDNAEWSPLHEACNRGNYSVVKLLHQHGADINLRGFANDSPLHDAARNGHIRVVKFLVKSGADLTAKNASGRTPKEEAESVALKCRDNESLNQTVAFLTNSSAGEEDSKDSSEKSEAEESSEEEGEEEAEDQDVAKFLGVARSPSIQQAFEKIGLIKHSKVRLNFNLMEPNDSKAGNVAESSAAKAEDVYEFKSSSKEPTPDPSSAAQERKDESRKESEAERGPVEEEEEELKRKKRKEETPAVREGGKESPVPKVRSTRGSSSEKTKKPGQGSDRKSPLLSGTSSPAEEVQEDDQKKVPPLKIVLTASPQDGPGGKGEKTDKEGEMRKEEKQEVEEVNNRVTRSRANQGTPGPSEGGDSQTNSQQSDSGPDSGQVQSGSQSSERTTTSTFEYNVKKRRLRSQVEEVGAAPGAAGAATAAATAAAGTSSVSGPNAQAKGQVNEPMNDIEKFLNIRKQVEQRRKNLFPVQPKPPEGFKDYLMNRKTYLLQQNASERLRTLPMIQPPHSLEGPLRNLFKEQEQERYKLRMKHVVEKEKLVLAVEQEILRVHGRAARALANQSLPFSVCTILRDEEIYTPIDPELEEKNRDIRSRYNGRLFLSWLQDVDDKWEKIKEQMVLRHHNEAESLNAVQKMDWEWKLNELSVGNQQQTPLPNPQRQPMAQIDDLHIPMVHVSDDFDLADCRQ